MAFLCSLLGVAILFIFANAEFVAVSQILIYIGGVLVLLLFGIMLTTSYSYSEMKTFSFSFFIISLICIIFGAIIFYSIGQVTFPVTKISANPYTENLSLPQKVGFSLMTDFIIPFEVSGVLILVALIGSATVANRNKR
jgi:NADH:ubiquinone oxidoreductase subunit 6 (subunit J)